MKAVVVAEAAGCRGRVRPGDAGVPSAIRRLLCPVSIEPGDLGGHVRNEAHPVPGIAAAQDPDRAQGLRRLPVAGGGDWRLARVALGPQLRRDDIGIGVTIADRENPVGLPLMAVDEPTLTMDFMVNSSPLAGTEGDIANAPAVLSQQSADGCEGVAVLDHQLAVAVAGALVCQWRRDPRREQGCSGEGVEAFLVRP